MKKIFSILLVCTLIISCEKNNQTKSITKVETYKEQNVKKTKSEKYVDSCPVDSLQMETSEYEGTTFYSENTMRGSGVIHLSIDKKIEILNLDKTVFGSINPNSENEFAAYEIKFPKHVIARQIVPYSELQIFEFDSEFPNKDNSYLIIYMNKEKKLISKKDLNYNFLTWNEYIKSAFLQLTTAAQNISKDEQKYLYKVIKIKNDSMLIKSISKSECDYVEDYKDISKWIRWKNDNCKLIKLSFCY